MTLLSLLIAAQALSGPTLAEIEALSPERAGERLLQGRTHERIVAARPKPERHIGVPGVTEFELIEAPRSVPGGCLRRRWTARFVAAADAVESEPPLLRCLFNGGDRPARAKRMSGQWLCDRQWRSRAHRRLRLASAAGSALDRPGRGQFRLPERGGVRSLREPGDHSCRPSIRARLGRHAVIGIRGVLAGRAWPAGHRRQVRARPA